MLIAIRLAWSQSSFGDYFLRLFILILFVAFPQNLKWPSIFFLISAPGANFQQILQEASMRIRAKYDFYEMTLQVNNYWSFRNFFERDD
jgi:hypothetical protein